MIKSASDMEHSIKDMREEIHAMRGEAARKEEEMEADNADLAKSVMELEEKIDTLSTRVEAVNEAARNAINKVLAELSDTRSVIRCDMLEHRSEVDDAIAAAIAAAKRKDAQEEFLQNLETGKVMFETKVSLLKACDEIKHKAREDVVALQRGLDLEREKIRVIMDTLHMSIGIPWNDEARMRRRHIIKGDAPFPAFLANYKPAAGGGS
jgi:cell division protein FtsB